MVFSSFSTAKVATAVPNYGTITYWHRTTWNNSHFPRNNHTKGTLLLEKYEFLWFFRLFRPLKSRQRSQTMEQLRTGIEQLGTTLTFPGTIIQRGLYSWKNTNFYGFFVFLTAKVATAVPNY